MTSGTRSTEAITLRRRVPSGHIATAKLEIRQPGGNLSPGFSITGELQGASGAIGDELAQLIPELAPFARLHLSDLDGVPMHAKANARYWHEQATGLQENTALDWRVKEAGVTPAEYVRRLACSTLRIDALPAELDTLAAALLDALSETDDANMHMNARDEYERAFNAFVDEQRPRWKQEANDAARLFDRLRDEAQDEPDPDAELLAAEDGGHESGRGLLDLADEYGASVGERFDSREIVDAEATARLALEDPDTIPDERADARAFLRMAAELADEVGDEWPHGVTFIAEDEFTDYAQEFAGDVGVLNEDAGWPNNHIDWKAAADELRMDYSSVEIEGTTYLYR